MCGIIAYTGRQQAAPILIEALKTLEYRGYDSAGIAVAAEKGMNTAKVAGRVEALASSVKKRDVRGTTGIGHTRWATHGGVTDRNAHPHVSTDGSMAIVHNGIVENYLELKAGLVARGYRFASDTDSEVIVHMMDGFMKDGDNLETALRKTARMIRGAAAIVALATDDPGKVVGLRLGNAGGLVCGFGDGQNLLASDLLALLPHTNRVAYLESGEVAIATRTGLSFIDLEGRAVNKQEIVVERTREAAARGKFPHFMAKEIAEQPQAATACLRQRIDFERGRIELPELKLTAGEVRKLRQVVLIGMGTSLHAAMAGAHAIEAIARIPARAENASEFRYREPVIGPETLVVAVTQSGETADTLAAMDEARRRSARQFAVTEVDGSQATRIADATLLLRAGQEIGVASTKTMTCSMVVLTLLALYLGRLRGELAPDRERAAVEQLAALPRLLSAMTELEDGYRTLAERIKSTDHLLYLGRGPLFPLALEGALKMKEIAYIHAEGYPAGEMKHGFIALISDRVPTIVLAPRNGLYEKMLSNVNEVKARGGEVIAILTEGDEGIAKIVDHALYVPDAPELIQPMLSLVPMQLLAYHVAVGLNRDPDKPRNLAKTVTVE
ncbi:MAG: glutamine--fructose-6-phosphate transaminase (isomerizing) [SAR202 cluster bacterium]|nr:glutamine--fructose-6-phosphate transaminase (isomerizing) [SAR202 cluster bacterium]